MNVAIAGVIFLPRSAGALLFVSEASIATIDTTTTQPSSPEVYSTPRQLNFQPPQWSKSSRTYLFAWEKEEHDITQTQDFHKSQITKSMRFGHLN
ncbi:unnamed protein product [Linum trigynum]|uniref:Secreted protein n=1 Tax=Linum trigynum TaxID=586398 RepID=A0AAV2F693_9ROSI